MYDDIIWFDNYCKDIRLSYDIRGGQAEYSLLNLFYEGGHIKPTATTIEQMSGECFGNVSAKKYDEREVMRIA